MSAFMVSKDHIDALVMLSIHGPSESAARWTGINWAKDDPRSTHWSDQVWHEPATAGLPELRKSDNQLTADEIGRMLWDANAESLTTRYSDASDMLPDDYFFGYEYDRPHRKAPTAAEGLKLIACFGYQACEFDGWEDSEAFRFCESLKDGLIRSLAGYSSAPWEWSWDREVTA
jgi:hypothetical protein